MQKKESKINSWIDDLVWAISGPILVMPTMEDIPIPQDVLARIKIERLVEVMKNSKQASDVEAMWYISTASLLAPLDSHWTNVYMYLTRKFLLTENKELPNFLKEDISLDKYMEERPLSRLKEWLYKKSKEALKQKLKEEVKRDRIKVQVQTKLINFY